MFNCTMYMHIAHSPIELSRPMNMMLCRAKNAETQSNRSSNTNKSENETEDKHTKWKCVVIEIIIQKMNVLVWSLKSCDKLKRPK